MSAPLQENARVRESWLAEALEELAEIDDEVAEEHYPAIQDAAKMEARRIIEALAQHPDAPAVYPTPDVEIAIHFKSPKSPNSVLILLNDTGGADCFAYINEMSRRAHYATSSEIPDSFVFERLRSMSPGPDGLSARGDGIDPLQETDRQ